MTVHPTDAAARMQIRTGESDPWKADVYKRSETGEYDIKKDPQRTVNRAIQDIPTKERFAYHDRALNRNELIEGINQQANQHSAEIAWANEKARQEKEYALYQAEAASVGGTPYYGGDGNFYIQNLDVGETGQMRMNLTNASQIRRGLINAGSKMIGTGYAFGGGGPSGPGWGRNSRQASTGILYYGAGKYGFDCSSLVQYAYAQVGLRMPRTAAQQARLGRITSIGNLKPGDLVAWGRSLSSVSHIAIYTGNGMILESSPGVGVRRRYLGNGGFDAQAFGVAMTGL